MLQVQGLRNGRRPDQGDSGESGRQDRSAEGARAPNKKNGIRSTSAHQSGLAKFSSAFSLFQTHLESVEKVLATFKSVELKRVFLNEYSSVPHG